VALHAAVRHSSGRSVLARYTYYGDGFGIRAHALELEWQAAATGGFVFSPYLRLYGQSAADHFMPYGRHAPGGAFHTSDYDLAELTSAKAGLSMRRERTGGKSRLPFQGYELRLASYMRSDGLTALQFTLLLSAGQNGRKRPPGR
jgi:hypothetical protein